MDHSAQAGGFEALQAATDNSASAAGFKAQ